MKKIRMSFMLATFAIAIGAAFAFTPKHKADCDFLRKCGSNTEFIPISQAPGCNSDDNGDCKYQDAMGTPCPDPEPGCTEVPLNSIK
jgi:hypothetical protein